MVLVEQFNKVAEIDLFLLNGKSGGTGLNLIGANKMILLDTDWNPANDLQVMGRVWRDGQLKPVHIYRLISCGTFEERILQRQIAKDVLSQNIVDDRHLTNSISDEEMKELFSFTGDGKCLTFKDA